MKRFLVVGIVLVFVLRFPRGLRSQFGLSIATGGTGGVYYPLGGGMANIISKHIPYTEATAEVTSASVDNCRLVGAGKAEIALVMADTGWDAYQGSAKFKEKIPLRTIAVLYPNNMHIVTLEGKGIEKVTDLKGKRVSTGAPGSGTEVMALRILEAYGLDPTKDMTRDKLGLSESAGALKDRKIDAFFWVGGLPTASVTDFGSNARDQNKTHWPCGCGSQDEGNLWSYLCERDHSCQDLSGPGCGCPDCCHLESPCLS